MGQHRTRQQKEHASTHRVVQSATGLYTLSGTSTKVKTRAIPGHSVEERKMIMGDLRKTLLVSAYVMVILLVLWWKLK